jgi:pimeloyl-ACP methyl ester carboxylesterase
VLEEVVDDRLSEITVPTVVIWGAFDELVPLEEGRDYARRIPHARLEILPDAAHASCVETPESFLAALSSTGALAP